MHLNTNDTRKKKSKKYKKFKIKLNFPKKSEKLKFDQKIAEIPRIMPKSGLKSRGCAKIIYNLFKSR